MCIYTAFFCVLFTFYGLPIHIMRDVFMTTRSFVKRLHALLRYRQALRDMNKYPDATAEELGREDTCIICREEMHPWDAANPGQVERSRPKKLPCGHILHFGCLKSWLERQQVCPTCRRPVVMDAPQPDRNGDAPVFRFGLNFPARNPGQQQPADGAAPAGAQVAPAVRQDQNGGHNNQQGNRNGRVRMFNFGPVRIGFAQGDEGVIRDMAQQMGMPPDAANPPAAAEDAPVPDQDTNGVLDGIRDQIADVNQRVVLAGRRVQQDMQQLQVAEAQLHMMNTLLQEMTRLSQMGQAMQQQPVQQEQQPQRQQPAQQQQSPVQQEQQPHGQHPAQPHENAPLTRPIQPDMRAVYTYPPQPTSYYGLPLHQPYPAPYYQAAPAVNRPIAAGVATPTVTRHGGAPFSAAIPAGSPDLPEGVVIPTGWSLLPLRRLDDGLPPQAPTTGVPQAQPPQPASIPAVPSHVNPVSEAQRAAGNGAAAGQGSARSGTQAPQLYGLQDPSAGPLRDVLFHQFTQRQAATAAANGATTGQGSTTAVTTEPEPRGRSPPVPSSSSHPAEGAAQAEPPVAAPTPVLPNWGGPAQLFGAGGAGARDTAASTPVQEQHEEEPTPAHQDGSSNGGTAEDKGKAKAVTVEDDESENDT